MIYFSTALIWEAQPLITALSLKLNKALNRFSIYENEEFCLIVTGSGPLNAAIGLTYLLSSKTIHSNDLFINIGICGCLNPSFPIGSGYFIHKIKEHSTNMTYYPDMLYAHDFDEASLETSAQIVDSEHSKDFTEPFIDMEAAGLYRAGAYFFKPHQMMFFKIISDYLASSHLTSDDVSAFIQPYIAPICGLAHKIANLLPLEDSLFTENEEDIIEEFELSLHLSVAMKNKLKQVLLYQKNNGNSIENLIHGFYKEHDITDLKIKKEGKKYFELFISRTM